MLNHEQEDVLKEMMNVFVGDAARLLSELTDRRIYISIPKITMANIQKVSGQNLDLGIPDELRGSILSSSLNFGQRFNGKAELLFPVDKVKQLSLICEGEDFSSGNEESDNYEITDTDFDLMKEIGNIILNAVVGGIANQIKEQLSYNLLEIEIHDVINYKKRIQSMESGYILILFVSFRVDQTEIVGAIIINFSMDSVSFLLEEINRIIEELHE